MKRMILANALLACLNASTVLADEKNFQEHKARALKKIEERMAKMAEHKSCVESATDKNALKACHEKMKAWHDSQKEEKEHHEK